MKEALKKNPDIKFKILYGYKDKDPNSSKDERITTSRKYIKEYEKEFGSALESKETNTHVKLVIADDKCFLIGSMNFLSFLGDYRYVKEDGLRHEVVMLSHDKEMLQELKEAYFNW
jgi:phosphatidylserine/phosphatidylglycerophosphate/cardiolipin synthase-like enzyme